MNAAIPIGPPYIPGPNELRPFAGEICLTAGILAVLIVPMFVRRSNLVVAMAVLLSLAAAVALLPFSIAAGDHFRGLLLTDSLATGWKLILYIFTAGVVLLWLDHTRRRTADGDAVGFFVPLLGATLGLSLMGSTDHLVTIVLAIATASLPSYLLAASRKASPLGAEAAIKYVLFGAVTGAVMIYGVTFWYGATGSLRVSAAVPAGAAVAIAAAGIAALVGIGFKIAAVPVHSWCPDVFEGAPLEVTAFLSVASKGAGLVLLLRLMAITAGVPGLSAAAVVVGIVGAVTATVGNTAAIKQTGMKRLLAYSSIAQAGYLLCLLTPATNPADAPAVARAVLLYLAVYAFMNLGAFAVTAVVERQTGGDKISDFAGLGRSSPAAAVSMVLCLLSLIGLPPVSGLAAKVNLLWIVGRTGPFGHFLALVILVNTVISAFYYFRIIRAMYFEAAESTRGKTGPLAGALLSIGCAAALVITFVGFGPLYTAVSHVASPAATPLDAARR